MDVLTLPDLLPVNTNNQIAIYDYQTASEVVQQHVILQRNAFSFLINGSKEVFFDKSSVATNSSRFLLMKKGRCLMTEKLTANTQHSYRSILLFFSDEVLANFVNKHKIKYALLATTKKSVFSFEYDDFLRSFTKSLISISKLTPTLQAALLNTKFEELITYLISTQKPDFLASLLFEIQEQNQSFIEVVEANKLNKLSLKELAFLSNMSVSTFKRAFEKHYNHSPSKWFWEKRLEHAAFLLKNKSIRASDIFEQIGYENLSAFIQAFKTKYGVTPKQFQLV